MEVGLGKKHRRGEKVEPDSDASCTLAHSEFSEKRQNVCEKSPISAGASTITHKLPSKKKKKKVQLVRMCHRLIGKITKAQLVGYNAENMRKL